MTEEIVPRNLFLIATRIEEEASNLKVCQSLMNEALQFTPKNTEAACLAQSQLFFLVGALGDLGKRLNDLESVAYDMARMEKSGRIEGGSAI